MSHRNKLMYHDTNLYWTIWNIDSDCETPSDFIKRKKIHLGGGGGKFAENSICNLNVQQRARSRMKYLARKKKHYFPSPKKKRI